MYPLIYFPQIQMPFLLPRVSFPFCYFLNIDQVWSLRGIFTEMLINFQNGLQILQIIIYESLDCIITLLVHLLLSAATRDKAVWLYGGVS